MTKRVAVILSEEEYVQVKKQAGLVPLSAWFRYLALPPKSMSELAQEVKDPVVLKAAKKLGDAEAKKIRASIGICPHHKQRGELCYKCDPRFGNPVIG